MLPFVIKTFSVSIFEWPLKTGFIVSHLDESFEYPQHTCMV